jgi:hypothetical protein
MFNTYLVVSIFFKYVSINLNQIEKKTRQLGIQKVRYATCYTLVWPNARAAPLEGVPENVIPLDSLTIV